MTTKCKTLYTEVINCCDKIILFERNKTFDFEIVKEEDYEADLYKIYENATDYAILDEYDFDLYFDAKNYLRKKNLEHLKQLEN